MSQELRTMTRRQLLSRAVAAGAAIVVGPGFIAGKDGAWASTMNALKPETMATLVQGLTAIWMPDGKRTASRS